MAPLRNFLEGSGAVSDESPDLVDEPRSPTGISRPGDRPEPKPPFVRVGREISPRPVVVS